ncbi:MAG: hypothetical protein ACRDDH_11895 [Cetobacterium sp.]|uniref:hypothetical protein n=1 Tax=Cetobacterium sp. TaxID=2071632 RepID=UPI003EE56719
MEFKKNWRNTLPPGNEARRRNTAISHKDAAELEGVSVVTIRCWRKKHLTREEYIRCGSIPKDQWTQEQELWANDTTLTNHEVATLIGKTYTAVRKWRQRYLTDVQKEELLQLKGFNLRQEHKYKQAIVHKSKPVSIRTLKLVAEYIHLPTRDIAQLIGRPEKSVDYIKKQIKELKEMFNGIENL